MAIPETVTTEANRTPFGNRITMSLATFLFTLESVTVLFGSKPDPVVAIWVCTIIAAGTNWRWNQPGTNHHSLIGHIYQAIE